MRSIRLFLFLLTVCIMASPALAQDEYVVGDYKLALTIDGTKYRLPVGGYRLSRAYINGDSVTLLHAQVTSADAQAASLPSGSTIKGKTSTKTRFFKRTASGEYQRLPLSKVRIAGVGTMSGGIVLQLELGGNDFSILSPRDVASGIKRSELGGQELEFTGKTVQLGGNDWE